MTPPFAQKHIVIFVSTMAYGGAERHALNLAKHLQQRGYRLTVLVYSNHAGGGLEKEAERLKLVFLGFRGIPTMKEFQELRTFFVDNQPDVVFTVNETTNVVASAAKLAGSLRGTLINILHSSPGLIYFAHNDTSFKKSAISLLRYWSYRISLKLSDTLVFVSDTQKAEWTKRKLTITPTKVIRNGVDINYFSPAPDLGGKVRNELGISPQTIVVTLVGAFRPEKNQAQLVRVVSRLRDQGYDVAAIFVGTGPDFSTVQNLAVHLTVERHCFFIGAKSDVRPYLNASDFGILCSTSETLSLAALEFLASGVPMILSDVGAAKELVEEGVNGFVFPTGDDDALCEILTKAIVDGTQANMRHKARESVVDKSLAHQYDSFDRLIEQSISN
ncbi:glycosyltransferase family 4 protein [Devosia sediminis]|uniref:Glycosyltransferase family 4 protein n=1 Tax=Devosia sediminis TaxID=2798801 RepID=A0A934IVT5_9HYPH|nr:glycosyltransferase family 4 protein [Devosia sediminis]MBJ3783125.1 glycosyltransferase family 4 protein [Devosia sediminis]